MKGKTKLNFYIDAVMFLLMAAMAGIGFMMKYVMPPGKERALKYGGSVDLYFLGLDRHQWGTIHLWIGIALIVLLVLHVVLHWNLLVGIFRNLVPSGAARLAAWVAFLILGVALLLGPLFVKPQVVPGSGSHESHESQEFHEPRGSHGSQGSHGPRSVLPVNFDVNNSVVEFTVWS